MKKVTLPLIALLATFCVSCSTSTPQASDDIINPVIKDKRYPSAYSYKKNIVISPYKPHNLINVKGIKPGHFARDISTADLDANGKPIKNTAKIFKLPLENKQPAAQ